MCDSPVNCKPVSKHLPQNSGCQVKSTSDMHNFRRALLPTQAILDPSSNSQATGTLGMASEHSLSILFSKRPTCGPQLKMPRASRARTNPPQALSGSTVPRPRQAKVGAVIWQAAAGTKALMQTYILLQIGLRFKCDSPIALHPVTLPASACHITCHHGAAHESLPANCTPTLLGFRPGATG